MALIWKQRIGMLSVSWEINWTGETDVWRPMSCGNQDNGGLDYRIVAECRESLRDLRYSKEIK